MKIDLKEEWSFEIKYWIESLQSVPVELIISKDRSESYEMNRFHVFKLENGKYATVYEVGCSCYEPDEAIIDIHPTKKKALKSFNEWDKDN